MTVLFLPKLIERIERGSNLIRAADRVGQLLDFDQLLNRDRAVSRSMPGGDAHRRPGSLPVLLAVFDSADQARLHRHSLGLQASDNVLRTLLRICSHVLPDRLSLRAPFHSWHCFSPSGICPRGFSLPVTTGVLQTNRDNPSRMP